MVNKISDDFDDKKESHKEIDDRIIRESFSTENELNYYQNGARNVGLRESEKIIFQKYLNKKDKILDMGCGAGRTTFGMYELGYHNIVGMDITDAMIQSAKHIAKDKGMEIQFVIGDAKNLDIPDDSCDAVIFSFNGLMMIPKKSNRIQAMKEIKRVLKDKGYFIFTTHDRELIGRDSRKQFRKEEKEKRENGNQNRELFEYGDMKYENKDGKPMFLHIPNKEEILGYIQKVGFSLVENKLRSEIATESQKVEDFSKECIFWIVQKI